MQSLFCTMSTHPEHSFVLPPPNGSLRLQKKKEKRMEGVTPPPPTASVLYLFEQRCRRGAGVCSV